MVGIGESEWSWCMGIGWHPGRPICWKHGGHVRSPRILARCAKAGECEVSPGCGNLAQMGEGARWIGEEHHAVARDQQVWRGTIRFPGAGISHSEMDKLPVACTLERCRDEIFGDINSGHARLRPGAGDC